jgi:glutathione S-transferase
MAEIKLYQFGPITGRESASPFCLKLHYALRYKGLPFEAVNLASPSQVKKYNPRGKLPVLCYDGTLIADSTDAAGYVEQRHPEPRLYPQDDRERAQAMMLEDWADESLYWHIVYENWLIDEQYEKFAAEVFAPMPAMLRPLIKIIALRGTRANLVGQGLGRVNREEHRKMLYNSLDWLNNIADGAFLCGKELSVADVAVAAQVTCLVSPLTPVVAAEARKRTRLMSWYDRAMAAVS